MSKPFVSGSPSPQKPGTCSNQEPGSAKVFGLGLPKTGTTTLGRCLEILGYSHAPYSRRLVHSYLSGNHSEIYEISRDYGAFEDLPWSLMFRALASAYPDAFFVLTRRRSADTWLRSLRRHIRAYPERSEEGEALRNSIFGAAYPWRRRDSTRYVEFYERHNAEVREFFAGHDRFAELCWEEGDEWARLCTYLGTSQPAEEFPLMNPAKRLGRIRQIRVFLGTLLDSDANPGKSPR